MNSGAVLAIRNLGLRTAHNLFLHLFYGGRGGWCGAIPDRTVVVWTGSVEGPQSEPGPLAVWRFSVASLAAGIGSNADIRTKALWFVFAITVAAGGERKRSGHDFGGPSGR